jgi:DUF218 domain
MTAKKLLVLFGHTNLRSGELSATAVLRCEKALQIANSEPGTLVLPTGAFGGHFNESLCPHHHHRTEYLVAHGLPRERILPGTTTSNTLEDVFAARRVAIEGDFGHVELVSSSFHIPRIRFIAERVLPDLSRTYGEALAPPTELAALEEDEKRSFAELKAEWVRVPLYRKGRQFPTEIYAAAGNEQRHYDSLSLAVITAIIVVAAYGTQVSVRATETPSSCDDSIRQAVGAVLIAMLYVLYSRLATWARTGRRVQRFIEVSFGEPGFSLNVSARSRLLPSVVWWVGILASMLGGLLAISAACAFITCRW